MSVHQLPPIRFRYHDDDHATYGGDWYVYDESALTRVPVRQLIAIERTLRSELGINLDDMMRGLRVNDQAAHLAASWVARHLDGYETPLAEYAPLVMLMEWAPVPGAGDADPPATASPSSGEG